MAVQDSHDVGAVRRAVAEMAWDGPRAMVLEAEGLAGRLAGDLLSRPGGGFVLARPLREPVGVELLAVDCDLNGWPLELGCQPRREGSGDPAGAVTFCDVWSYSGCGTAVLARVRAERDPAGEPPAGGVSVAALEGEPCGDAWAVAEAEGFFSVFVVDGLGHGRAAEAAADAGVAAFLEEPADDPEAVLRRVHDAMLGTRGGVAAVCRIETARERAVFAGLGNIAARLFVGGRSQTLLSSHGAVGAQVAFSRPRVETIPWDAGSALVVASDGLRPNIDLRSRPGLLGGHPTLSAAVLLRDLRKGTDDATVVVARGERAGTG